VSDVKELVEESAWRELLEKLTGKYKYRNINQPQETELLL